MQRNWTRFLQILDCKKVNNTKNDFFINKNIIKIHTMATELCNDVRNLILERMEVSEDMYLAVIEEGVVGKVMFYVSRNMRDPVHHVRFCYSKNGREYSYLMRNPDSLRMMIESVFYKHDGNVGSIYVQGERKPPSMNLTWRVQYGQQKTELHEYVQDHMLEFHYINHDLEDIDSEQWIHPLYMQDIIKRITILISTA